MKGGLDSPNLALSASAPSKLLRSPETSSGPFHYHLKAIPSYTSTVAPIRAVKTPTPRLIPILRPSPVAPVLLGEAARVVLVVGVLDSEPELVEGGVVASVAEVARAEVPEVKVEALAENSTTPSLTLI